MICRGCFEDKAINKFYKCKTSVTGYNYFCKSCTYKKRLYRERTIIGCIKKTYENQKYSSASRGLSPPEYPVEWLIAWCIFNNKFDRIYNEWVESGYNTWLKPSIDRIDDNIGYTKDNIQLMTWYENHEKARNDMLNGNNNKNNSAVLCFNMDGEYVCEYHSTREAGRNVGIPATNISACFYGRQQTASGYTWYKRDKFIEFMDFIEFFLAF